MAETVSVLEQRLSSLRFTQQQRWTDGERVLVENLLGQSPELNDTEVLLDLLYAEVLLREEHGEQPRLEEYVMRFPHLSEPLRRQFALHQALASSPSALGDTTREGHTPAKPSFPVAQPQQIGPYEILGELGRGGMGVVWKGRHRTLSGRIAAIKTLRGSEVTEQDLARFRLEVEAAAGLSHPNIVVVYEWSGEEPPFVALEYIEGGTLAQKINGTPLPPQEAGRLLIPVARAVQFAHERRLLHRDLKPGNLLIGVDGTPKVTDFGLVKRLDVESGQTHTGAIIGTPSYMSPEQASGVKDLTPAADVYALGAILYEMLTGRPPFKADSVLNTLGQVIAIDPVPPRSMQSHVPRDLEIICLQCLRKDPRRRYQSAAALADDLERWLRGDPITARPPSMVERGLHTMRRHPVWAALAAATVVGVFILFGVWWRFTEQVQQEMTKAEEQRRIAQQEMEKAKEQQRIAEQERDRVKAERERTAAVTVEIMAILREHLKVIKEGKTRDFQQNDPGCVLFLMACSYADAGERFRTFSTLTPEERARFAEVAQSGAVELLRDAHEVTSYFGKTENAKKLRTDPRLNPLRERKDFKDLLARTGTTP